MKLHKRGCILLAGILTAGALGTFTGCSGSGNLAASMYDFGDDYYKSVESRYTLNYDEMIYDDFTGDTIDKSKWVISDSVWDQWGTDQNGVRPQNVFLLKDEKNPDTHLLLRANGSYYSGDALSSAVDGVNTGACLSTVEALGPGRYDIKMKACPRIGALTSMWLFSWFNKDDGSVQQNEIDIEIGLNPIFNQVFFTTWTSPSSNSSYPTNVDFMVNDGDWHIYSFDWVTDAEVPYVDYYVDGVKLLTIDSNVPTTNATLSIGIWVPCWAGGGGADSTYNVSTNSRMFDSDYAEISWWRYVPFQMGGWEQRPVENRNYDPDYQPEVLTSMPAVNKCANGDFERGYGDYYKTLINAVQALDAQIERETDETKKAELKGQRNSLQVMLDADSSPWEDFTIYDSTDEFFVEGSSAEQVKDPLDSANTCAKIVNGGSLGQWLRAAGQGYRFRVTGKFRTEGDAVAAFRYTYINGFSTTSRTNGSDTVEIGSSSEWKTFEFEFTVSKQDAQSIRYYLINKNAAGTSYFDDIQLTYLGHN